MNTCERGVVFFEHCYCRGNQHCICVPQVHEVPLILRSQSQLPSVPSIPCPFPTVFVNKGRLQPRTLNNGSDAIAS